MILGISHLCLVTKKNSDLSKKILKKYSIKFTKKNLKNNNCKKKFLFTKHKSHNISFYKKKNYYNIELIEYDKIKEFHNLINITKDKITINVKNPEFEKKIFKRFAKIRGNYIYKKDAIFNSLNFKIKVNKLEVKRRNYLDNEGINTIAFFCKDINTLRKKFIELKINVTKIFSIKFLNFKYKIFLAKTKNQIFYEFLETL